MSVHLALIDDAEHDEADDRRRQHESNEPYRSGGLIAADDLGEHRDRHSDRDQTQRPGEAPAEPGRPGCDDERSAEEQREHAPRPALFGRRHDEHEHGHDQEQHDPVAAARVQTSHA